MREQNFTVVLEVTRFGTEDERLQVEYNVRARDEGHAISSAIGEAANDGHYVDEVEVLHVNTY